jgi:hypothetical protein
MIYDNLLRYDQSLNFQAVLNFERAFTLGLRSLD